MAIVDLLYFYFPLEEPSGSRINVMGTGNLTLSGTLIAQQAKMALVILMLL